MPLLSIIIPTFNSAKTLRACLESIVCQTFQDFEVLIIDGISTDHTVEMIMEYATKYPYVKWVSEPDKGIYDAMNKGIDMSKGEWLYFLGSDDSLFDENVVSKVSKYLMNGYNYVYGNIYLINKNIVLKNKIVFHQELLIIPIYHQSIIYKKTSVVAFEKYDLKYPIHADTNLSVKFFQKGTNQIKYVDLTIAKYSNTGISATNTDTFFHAFLLTLMKEKDTYNFLKFVFYKYNVNKYLNRKGVIPYIQNLIYVVIIKICKLVS